MKPVKIEDKLFLGDIHSASNAQLLEAYGIVAIVNIGGGENKFPTQFAYLRISMLDREDSDIKKHLDVVVNFITEHRTRGGVLVHCKGGICRSASFLIAYLMRSEKLSVIHAHGIVKGKRPAIRPRPCFLSVIDKWAQGFKKETKQDGKEEKKEIKKELILTEEKKGGGE